MADVDVPEVGEEEEGPAPAIERPEPEEQEEDEEKEPLNELEEEEDDENNEDEDNKDLIPEEEEPQEIDLSKAKYQHHQQEQKAELVRFLKEFSKDPEGNYTAIAKLCQINRSTAANYIRKFNGLVINTLGDKDFPKRLLEVLSKEIPEPNRLTKDEIFALKNPLLEKYSNYQIIDDKGKPMEGGIGEVLKNNEQNKLSKMVEESKKIEKNNNDYPNTRTVANTVVNSTGNQQQQQQQHQQADIPNQAYAALQNSTNSKLMRWVLDRTPLVYQVKVPAWMEVFEANEQYYMTNPMDLMVDLQGHFGAKAGENAFRKFKQMAPNYLRRDQGFFNDPWNPQDNANPYGAYGVGGGMGRPNIPNFGQVQHPAIPPGMDINTPAARQLIDRWEQQQQDNTNYERMQRTLQQYITAKMMSLTDDKNGDGGNGFGGPGGYNGMVAAGLLVPVQTVSPEGEVQIRYEPARNSQFQAQQQQQNYGLEVTKVMMQMYSDVLSKSNDANKAYEPIVQASIQKMLNNNPVQDLIAYKDMMDKWNPNGNQYQNLDIARLELDKFKIAEDVRMTKSHEDREWDRYRWEKEREDRMESQAAENTHSLINGIVNMTSNNIDKILALIFRGNGNGQVSYPAGAVPPQQQGQPQQGQYTPEQIQELQRQEYLRKMREMQMQRQPPQQQRMRREPTPYELEMLRRRRMEMSRQMNQPYEEMPQELREGQVQQDGQRRVQPAHIHQNTVKTYSPHDFEHLSPAELEDVEQKGMQSYESIVSFMDSVRAVKYAKIGGGNQAEQQLQPEQQEQVPPVEEDRGWPGPEEKELTVEQVAEEEIQSAADEAAKEGDVVG